MIIYDWSMTGFNSFQAEGVLWDSSYFSLFEDTTLENMNYEPTKEDADRVLVIKGITSFAYDTRPPITDISKIPSHITGILNRALNFGLDVSIAIVGEKDNQFTIKLNMSSPDYDVDWDFDDKPHYTLNGRLSEAPDYSFFLTCREFSYNLIN